MLKIKVEKLDINTRKSLDKYPSIAEAAEAHGVDESTIRKAANGTHNSSCGFKWRFIEEDEEPEQEGGKILILDIETAPAEAFVFRYWKQNILPHQLIADWYMLTWAAKWLGRGEVFSDRLTGEEAAIGDDNRLVKSLWELLDEADIVVAHNGDKFDIPKINSRFVQNNLPPPSSYKQVDTYKVASRQFGFSYNGLNSLADLFGFEGKKETTFELWRRAKRGDDSALLEMEVYNIGDIVLLEKVYLKLLPYIKGHPNMDLYMDQAHPVCPNCGSDKVRMQEDKYFYTQAVKYQLFRCFDCKSVSRAKTGIKFLHKKQISAIPR